MSSESAAEGGAQAPSGTIPVVVCRVCGQEVPAAAFCGFCGAHLSLQRGNGPDWLRVRAYSAAIAEHVLRLSVVSTLFPHLPHRSRTTFRMGFAALIVLLIVFALLRWQIPLVAVSSLGFALLYLIFLEESDVYGDDDLPAATMVLTAVLGAALGISWTLWAGPIVARSYFAIGGLWVQGILLYAVAIPVTSAVLLLIPAVVVRMMRPRQLESLDGFLIGSLGAVAFAAAATLSRLAPQLSTGLLAGKRFVGDLLIEAGIQGVAVPVTAAAAGGLVGAALWHTGRADQRQRLGVVVLAVIGVLVVYAALGIIDVSRIWPPLQLFLHLLIAALAILAVRIAVHIALLHEEHEAWQRGPILCAECHHVVPYMAFCPNCGVSTRASSRSSRKQRQLDAERPEPHDQDEEQGDRTGPSSPTHQPSYAMPAASYPTDPARHTAHSRFFVLLGLSLAVAVAVILLVAWLITPPVAPINCQHPGCGRPPGGVSPGEPAPAPGPFPNLANLPAAAGDFPAAQPNSTQKPVQTYPRFSPADGSWSVAYPPNMPGFKKATDGVYWQYPKVDSEVVEFGQPAGNQSAQDIVQSVLQQHFPSEKQTYVLPNAMVGYQPGYGVIADFIPQGSTATYTRGRVMAVVAVKNGIALGMIADGPYKQFTTDDTNHPSGADFLIALHIGYYLNSFTWAGDPPR
ncbi:MAG: zinc ribbon domain-containing protein [Mycobacteriaceae bacterium]|nr:zinc ribbon domain-containing protein [Mycobacteriaceae bacterium]